MKLYVGEYLRIELLNKEHAAALFLLVDSHRDYLREWLSFVDHMQDQSFAEQFIEGSIERNKKGLEYAFMILEKEVPVGRIGVYQIDLQARKGEIGYWVKADSQGKGIVTKSCRVLLEFCFSELMLHRIEIKCGTENWKSKVIPERLQFHLDGIIHRGEFFNDRYIDLHLYSISKSNYMKDNSKIKILIG